MARNAAVYGPFGDMLDDYSKELGKTIQQQIQLPAGYEKVSIAKKYYSSIEKEFVPLTDAQLDQLQSQKGDFYAFDDVDLKPTEIKNNRSQVMATLGFRF